MLGIDASSSTSWGSAGQWLESAGGALVEWTVAMNLWTLGLLAGVLVIDRLLSKRVSAGWRIALYAVVAVRLALPLAWTSPVGLVQGGSDVGVRVDKGTPGGVAVLSDIPLVGYVFQAPPMPSPPPLPPPVATPLTWRALVLPIYAAGVTALAIVLWRRQRGARRLASQAAPMEAGHAEMRGDVRVRVHATAGPVLVGAFGPTLVVPESLARDGATGELRAVLAHERAHVRRGDHVLAPVLAWATVLLWPIAAAWVAAARVRSLMEQAADELALRGADAPGRAEYGEALVRIAQGAGRAAVLARLAPRATLGFADGLESRVRALANTRRWGTAWQGGTVTVACAVLLACAGSRAVAIDEPAVPAGLQQAVKAPDPNAPRIVRVVVLPGVPKHPKVPELKMQQTAVEAMTPETAKGADDTTPREVPTMSADEARDVARTAGEQALPAMMSPVIMVNPGQDATVTVGDIQEVVGEGREDPVNVPNGVVLRAGVVADAKGVPANASAVHVEYKERRNGQDVVWTTTGNMIVPHGRSAWVFATGLKGEPVRMLLISVEPAPDNADVNPMDPAGYPYAEAMIWMMELREPLAFDTLLPGARKGERSGTAEFAGDGAVTKRIVSDAAGAAPGAWACVVPAQRLREFGDALYNVGAKHVASPAVLGKPGKAITVSPGSFDKAHSSTGPYGLTLSISMAQNRATALQGVQWLALADGSTRRTAAFEGVRLEEGEALAVLQEPAKAGEAWAITVYNPSVISQRKDYPFQVSRPLQVVRPGGQVEVAPEEKQEKEKAPK